jgi:hypothetical protein
MLLSEAAEHTDAFQLSFSSASRVFQAFQAFFSSLRHFLPRQTILITIDTLSASSHLFSLCHFRHIFDAFDFSFLLQLYFNQLFQPHLIFAFRVFIVFFLSDTGHFAASISLLFPLLFFQAA